MKVVVIAHAIQPAVAARRARLTNASITLGTIAALVSFLVEVRVAIAALRIGPGREK